MRALRNTLESTKFSFKMSINLNVQFNSSVIFYNNKILNLLNFMISPNKSNII